MDDFIAAEEMTLQVGPMHEGKRLDQFLVEQLEGYTRSYLQKLIEQNRVHCNGAALSKNHRLRTGSLVCLSIPSPVALTVTPEKIPLCIVYEDEDLLVVNKKKGMVVHPSPGNETGTLVHALLAHCGESLSGIGGVLRPGIVHRIDKNTSGLLLVAKNDLAHRHLAAQIASHSLLREYEAMVYGHLQQPIGEIALPIGRSQKDRKKMAIVGFGGCAKQGKQAVTHFQLLEQFSGFAHMKFRLETGRTHQIRVHMAHIGHPIAGDDVYGPKKVIRSLQGQCLHAKTVGFSHPTTGELMRFSSEPPLTFEQFLQKRRNDFYGELCIDGP